MVIGSVVATIILSGILLWVRPAQSQIVPYSRATLALFLACAIVLTIAGRTIVRWIVQRRHRVGKDLDRVLIAGNGELARAVFERMNAGRHELGFTSPAICATAMMERRGNPCLGTIADAEAVVSAQAIDHVFVALPMRRRRR